MAPIIECNGLNATWSIKSIESFHISFCDLNLSRIETIISYDTYFIFKSYLINKTTITPDWIDNLSTCLKNSTHFERFTIFYADTHGKVNVTRKQIQPSAIFDIDIKGNKFHIVNRSNSIYFKSFFHSIQLFCSLMIAHYNSK